MKIKKWMAVPIVAGVLFVGGAVAVAAVGWGVSGTAKATGSIGTVVPTTGSGVLDSAIYPNTTVACDITFANTNAVDVTITEVKGDGYVVTSGPDAGAQAGPGVTTTPFGSINDVTGLSIVVPKNGTKLATVPGCVTALDIPAGSQGDAITFHFVTVGATS